MKSVKYILILLLLLCSPAHAELHKTKVDKDLANYDWANVDATDLKVGSVTQAWDADLDDLADGTLSKNKVEDSTEWDTAYTWGDHGLVGYLTTVDISSNTNLAGTANEILLTGDVLSLVDPILKGNIKFDFTNGDIYLTYPGGGAEPCRGYFLDQSDGVLQAKFGFVGGNTEDRIDVGWDEPAIAGSYISLYSKDHATRAGNLENIYGGGTGSAIGSWKVMQHTYGGGDSWADRIECDSAGNILLSPTTYLQFKTNPWAIYGDDDTSYGIFYGGNGYQDGAYVMITGDSMASSPYGGSISNTIRNGANSNYSIISYDGASSWINRFTVNGNTGLTTASYGLSTTTVTASGNVTGANLSGTNTGDNSGTDDQTASEVATNVAAFDTNLSAADDTVQKALDTIDDLALGGSSLNEILYAKSANLPATNTAVIDQAKRLLFDDTTAENCWWKVNTQNYQGGTLYADVYFSMASGEANEIQYRGYVMAYTPATDSADIDTDSYDSANDGVATTVAATAGRLYKQTITLTNKDSLARYDYMRFKLDRDATDGTNDDATGDGEVRYVVIHE